MQEGAVWLSSGSGGVATRRPRSSGVHEAQADGANGIVHVRVDDDDALPDTELDLAPEHGQCERWADQCRQQVVPPVAWRTMGVAVGKIAWQEAIYGCR